MLSRVNLWSRLRQSFLGVCSVGRGLIACPEAGEEGIPRRILTYGLTQEQQDLLVSALGPEPAGPDITDLSLPSSGTLLGAAEGHDLLVLGISQFDGPSPSLVRSITSEYPSLPVLVVAPESESETAGRCLAEGAMTYLLTTELSAPMLREAVMEAYREKQLEMEVHGFSDGAAVPGSRDPLTGFPDADLARDFFESEFRSAARWNSDICCLVIRLSGVDEIIQAHGSVFTDLVVRNIGNLIGKAARHADVVSQLGDGEFVLILPGASLAQGSQRAQQILTLLGRHQPALFPPALQVKVNIGVASRIESTATGAADLLRFAQAMAVRGEAEGPRPSVSVWNLPDPPERME